jgi:hypothetical protein
MESFENIKVDWENLKDCKSESELLYRLLHRNSRCLYQYLEKEHLDLENELTDKQWKRFVQQCVGGFGSEVSEIGQEWFHNNVNRIREESM